MRQINLSVGILKEIGHGPLQHTRRSSRKSRCMFSARDTQTARFNADHLHLLVPDKRMEEPYGIAATTDAGDEAIRQPAFCRQNLSPSFPTDDRLKISDHHRIGGGSQDRTD